MNENVMSLLDAELEHAGEGTALSPQMLLLEQLRITPEKELKPMEFLFRLFGKPCFPRGELVAITGKAKSGKTFVTSMLMVNSLTPNPSRGGEGSSSILPIIDHRDNPVLQDILRRLIALLRIIPQHPQWCILNTLKCRHEVSPPIRGVGGGSSCYQH